jgi:hypothetical protein
MGRDMNEYARRPLEVDKIKPHAFFYFIFRNRLRRAKKKIKKFPQKKKDENETRVELVFTFCLNLDKVKFYQV